MSSTSPPDESAAVRTFFRERLLRLMEQLGERRTMFPLHPDPAMTSYYTHRKQTTLGASTFEVPGCESFEDFERALRELWTAQSHPELAALAPDLAELARKLYAREEQSDEVSP